MALAQRQLVRLISVDSAMLYRGMNIGTAKPTAAELRRHPHELIDILDPAQRYSAADFLQDARALLEDAFAKGELPVFVGGTMLYFKALRDGLADMPGADLALRAVLAEEARVAGLGSLHAQLRRVDPLAAEQISVHNGQRIMRALEVYRSAGRPISSFWAQQQRQQGEGGPVAACGGKLLEVALVPKQRSMLHERIDRRFEQMLGAGFVAEVDALFARGDLTLDMPSMRCVGYRQIWRYLEGAITLPEAISAARAATRRLAKRQLTWLRGWADCKTLTTLEIDEDPLVALTSVENLLEGES